MVLMDFSNIGYCCACAFCEAKVRPPRELTFRFLASYRQVWNLTGNSPSRSPLVIFDETISDWLCEFGEAIVPRIDKAIDLDDFSVHVRKSMNSTSCTDIFMIFNQSFEFIERLRFSNDEINVKVISYLQLCVAAVRHYCKTTLGLIISLSKQFTDKRTMTLATSKTPKV
jgi:hypothetical protein